MIDNTEKITTPYGEILKIALSDSTTIIWKKPLLIDIVSSPLNGGIVLSNGQSVEYPHTCRYEDEISLSVVPNDEFKFDKWSDGLTEVNRILTAFSDIELSAEFVKR